MFDWATAAFMKRRSRMAEASAPVPSAAQAAWRMNWRREREVKYALSIKFLFLDGELGRVENEMNHGSGTITSLGGPGLGQGEINNLALGIGRNLAAAQNRTNRIH